MEVAVGILHGRNLQVTGTIAKLCGVKHSEKQNARLNQLEIIELDEQSGETYW